MSEQQQTLQTEAEAAEQLGVAERTLQTWRHRGSGPAYIRISSRCVRYRQRDLNAWLESRLINPEAESKEGMS